MQLHNISKDPYVRVPLLDARELEVVIAPRLSSNHNETFLTSGDLKAEELEAVIAPRLAGNHNETFLSAGDLKAEDLECVIAPRVGF